MWCWGKLLHGTHEYYVWRSQITKKLIEERGFSFIAGKATGRIATGSTVTWKVTRMRGRRFFRIEEIPPLAGMDVANWEVPHWLNGSCLQRG